MNLSKNVFEINMLNVQCLTQVKMIEIENFLLNSNNPNIYLLIEKHQTRKSIKINNDIKTLNKMRDISDKKGGGFMIAWKDSVIDIEEIECSNSDILIANVTVGDTTFYSILVYVSTNDNLRNNILYKEIKRYIMLFQ